MKKITDKFQFGRYIESVREDAAGLPATQIDLIRKLGMLIEDALAEFASEKFTTPRSMGDLDDADGIEHLFADYPAFLTAEEAAAARYLSALYLARDSLNDGFGLAEDDLAEIKETGLDLLTWRLQGPAAKVSRLQQQRASNLRSPVTKEELEAYREKFIFDHGRERGWIKAACLEFDIDRKTLNNRMEE